MQRVHDMQKGDWLNSMQTGRFVMGSQYNGPFGVHNKLYTYAYFDGNVIPL